MANDFDVQIKWLNGSQIEIQATDSDTLSGTEKVLIMDGDTARQTTTQDIADLGGGGGGSSYLVYTALLNQTGTDDPVATVLQNTIGSIVWTRSGQGVYEATLSGAFPLAKTYLAAYANVNALSIVFNNTEDDEPANVLQLITRSSGFPADEFLYYTPIEIRVYP